MATYVPAPTGSGLGLSQLPYITADLTSMTLVDPDSLVSATTHAADFNKVVWNELASGSTDYAWASGANTRAPRYHAPLYAVNAAGANVRVTSDDVCVVQVRITKGTTVDEYDTEVVAGLCSDPTATTSTALQGFGGILDYAPGGNPSYGAWTGNSKVVSVGATQAYAEITTLSAGLRQAGVLYTTMTIAGVFVGNGSRNVNATMTTGTNLSLVIGVGTRGSVTVAAGEDANFKVEYRVITFEA